MPEPNVLGRPLRFWTRFALVWLMAITVTGAAVRLTGSGLGCLDWPTCTANEELDAPGFHSAIEFGNRVISGLAIIPVIAAWFGARAHRRDLLATIWLLAAGFMGQVMLGMLVTRTELDPRVVLGHFLLSIVLIYLGVVLDYRARHGSDKSFAIDIDGQPNRRRQIRGTTLLGLASIVIFVGTLVTGSGPHTGSESDGEPIPRLGFDIREITRVHSILAWFLVAAIVFGLVQVGRNTSAHPSVAVDRTWLSRIGALALVQGAVGYLQYATGVPVALVAVHIAGSVLLWTAIAWYSLVSREPVLDQGEAAGSAVPEMTQ